MPEFIIRALAWLDEWYLDRHPVEDGPVLRRINRWIDRIERK